MNRARNLDLFYFRHQLREIYLAHNWPVDLDSLTAQVVQQNQKLELTQEELKQSVNKVIQTRQYGLKSEQDLINPPAVLTPAERLAAIRSRAAGNKT